MASAGERTLAESEIDTIRALLGSKPRPVGWSERRLRLDEVGSTWPVASDVKCETVDCDGVPGEWSIVPGSAPSRVLLYFHGGGYCSGSIVSHRRLVTEAGRAARTRTLAISYRLAPEHPYPAAHEDALTAWRFLRRQGIAATDIAVGGDSAGGNLSIGVCLRAREESVPQPVAQLLVYPGTDFSQRLPSREMFGEGFYLSTVFMDRCEAAYMPDGADTTDPLLSPLQAKDLSGLAPAYVVTAGFDPLRDEGEAFARRIADDGGIVQLKRHAGLIHGFFNMVGVSRSARAAVDDVVVRLRDL
jgi:epsilon-lactone hydrolase